MKALIDSRIDNLIAQIEAIDMQIDALVKECKKKKSVPNIQYLKEKRAVLFSELLELVE